MRAMAKLKKATTTTAAAATAAAHTLKLLTAMRRVLCTIKYSKLCYKFITFCYEKLSSVCSVVVNRHC